MKFEFLFSVDDDFIAVNPGGFRWGAGEIPPHGTGIFKPVIVQEFDEKSKDHRFTVNGKSFWRDEIGLHFDGWTDSEIKAYDRSKELDELSGKLLEKFNKKVIDAEVIK